MPSGTTERLGAAEFAPNAKFLDEALTLLDGGGAVDVATRREALGAFASLPAPGARPGRGWKHDYDKLSYDELRWVAGRVTLPAPPRRTAPAAAKSNVEVDRPALATENAGGLYHIGGAYVDLPSGVDPRVTLLPLDGQTARTHAGILNGAHTLIVDWRRDRFAALATAFQNCGVLVHIPAGVTIDAPIQLVFSSAPDAEAVFPHIVVVAEAGARATVIERHIGDGDSLVCGIVEVRAAEGAQLDYVAVQQAGETARVFFSRGARVERDAAVRWHLAELGATLARSVIGADLGEPGARSETSAL
ncbi:MAG TPA: SufD family Fe-S cluster assembly protein, partial [Candidatus Elarobacter sp.]